MPRGSVHHLTGIVHAVGYGYRAPETEVPAAPDNQVILDPQFHRVDGDDQTLGPHVQQARFQQPGRMVVDQYEVAGGQFERPDEDLARMRRAAFGGARADHLVADETMTPVEKEDAEHLVRQMGHRRVDVGIPEFGKMDAMTRARDAIIDENSSAPATLLEVRMSRHLVCSVSSSDAESLGEGVALTTAGLLELASTLLGGHENVLRR